MSEKPTYKELEQRIQELEQAESERKQAEDELQKSEAELFAIYNHSPMIMLLVDEDRRVLKANRLALESTGRQHKEIEGLRGGEALKCIHAFDDPDGCGFGVDCKKCVVRNTVLDSIKTGNGHHNVEAPVQLDLGNGVIDLFFLVSTAPLNVAGTKTVLVSLENITERKQAEAALLRERNNLRNVFDSMEDGIYIVNNQYDIQYVNPVLVKEFGPYEGVKCYRYFHDRDKVCPWCKNQDVLAGKTVRWEWYSSKNERTYDLIDTPMTLSDGSIGKLEIFRDISERKQAEEALRASRDYLEELTNSIWDAVFSVKMPERVIEWANDSFRLIGYEPSECVGKDTSFLYSDQDGFLDFGNKLKNAMAAGKDVLHTEHLLIRKNGKTFPADITVTFHKENGQVIRVTSIIRDIIERKQAEEALHESEEKLTQAIQGNSIPTFLIDNNHIITHWNNACEGLTGFSSAEMVGTKKQWLAFYPSERPVLADLIMDEATEKEIDVYYEGKHHKSVLIEGAYEGDNFFPTLGEKGKWLFFTAAPLRDRNGNIIGAIQTFQDITKRRNTEEQLRQAQKMEAIGTLAGGVAHDFNNILTTIIGNAHMALMEVDKDGPLREELEEIKIAGGRASDLTRQLLAFSRKQVIKPEVLDLNNVINATEKMLKRMIAEDVEFQTVLKPELWKVHMDSGQVDQILINLAVNARDAMPQGGKLIIETANVDLDKNYLREHGIEGTPGHYVMLAISDTGSGMNKETQEHIFEPFFTTKEIGKGTGLGLSTVYGIAKQNNGFIWIYSELGQGSTFKVYLPRVERDVQAEEKERTCVEELGGSETVLIVEDDDSLRNFAQKALQQHGYRTLAAENGEEALKVGKEHDGQIDLLITDVVMPKMSGRETAERLQPHYPQMKVIYMSGYTDDAIVHHGVLAPGLNFIEKPFSPEGLARKVREVLDAEN